VLSALDVSEYTGESEGLDLSAESCGCQCLSRELN
jgi:hypothetical protein